MINQKLRTDLTEGLACLTDGQPIGGDQDHGHSMKVWELGWSNPGQDCSINHGRAGHSCDGLIHQIFVHPFSHGYSGRGLSLQEDCHTFLYPSVGMLSDTSHKLYSGEAERPASSISTNLPGDMEFCD